MNTNIVMEGEMEHTHGVKINGESTFSMEVSWPLSILTTWVSLPQACGAISGVMPWRNSLRLSVLINVNYRYNLQRRNSSAWFDPVTNCDSLWHLWQTRSERGDSLVSRSLDQLSEHSIVTFNVYASSQSPLSLGWPFAETRPTLHRGLTSNMVGWYSVDLSTWALESDGVGVNDVKHNTTVHNGKWQVRRVTIYVVVVAFPGRTLLSSALAPSEYQFPANNSTMETQL